LTEVTLSLWTTFQLIKINSRPCGGPLQHFS